MKQEHEQVPQALRDALTDTEYRGLPDGPFYAVPSYDITPVWPQYKEIMERLSGKYANRSRGFRFGYSPVSLIKEVASSGIMPEKNPLAFFPTPRSIISAMIQNVVAQDELIGWPTFKTSPRTILEPSAGSGAIASALRYSMNREGTLHVVELDPLNRALLEDSGFTLVGSDFLEYEPGAIYDLIFMNPPFSIANAGQAYIKHILHAFTLLKNGGTLVSIAPVSLTYSHSGEAISLLRDVCYTGDFERLEKGSFKESGTHVDTILLSMTRVDQSWRERPFYEGFSDWHTGTLAMIDNNDYAQYQEMASWRHGRTNNADIYHHYVKTIKKARLEGVFIDMGEPNSDRWTEIYAYARARMAEIQETS